ncbi:TRAP transporter small permease [Desulfopila inferna]|uniref:TRAP transporter small permease n=1 Tax=Desulfopila inferna TaxID=468528 RepID=UPI00196667B8|nr:TRAP transporter small permease [Desulfopila inferna]MBM9603608.1 TRAP transporter small permease [Desulfopila inferna]
MFGKLFDKLSDKLMFLGSLLLLAMVALTCLDVFGRLFGYPVFGAYELMSFMAALVAAAALSDTHAKRRHIGVEIITEKLSKKTRLYLDLVIDVVSFVIFCIVTWRMFILATNVRASGELSMNLMAPEYLIMGAVGVGFLLFAFAIVKTFFSTISKLRGL